jgi:peptide/nickel transport system permease protein
VLFDSFFHPLRQDLGACASVSIMKFRPNAMETVGALMVLSLAVIAILAPWLAPYDPTRAVANTFGDPAAPSRLFPLGTDQLGRDVLSRIIYGARISLTVGVAAMAVTMTIGVTIGLAAGFFGGAIDFALMRFTDVMLTLPALLLAMAFVAVLRPSILSILLVIGLVSWTQIARVVRAEALSMTQRDFVVAARALGAPSARLIVRHVMPNVMPIIVVMAVLGTSGTLLLDAGLSFLTLGVPPPTPSWGRMIEEATTYFRVAPWLAIFPGLAIFYAVLGFNLLGYGFLRGRTRTATAPQ